MLFKKEYKIGDVVTFFLRDGKEEFIATFKVELESLPTVSFYYLKGFTEKYGEEYGSHYSTWNKILSMYESWAVQASERTLKILLKIVKIKSHSNVIVLREVYHQNSPIWES